MYFELIITSARKAIICHRVVRTWYAGVDNTKSCLVMHYTPGMYLLLSGSMVVSRHDRTPIIFFRFYRYPDQMFVL